MWENSALVIARVVQAWKLLTEEMVKINSVYSIKGRLDNYYLKSASGYKTRWLLAWISLKFLAKFSFLFTS